MMKADIRFTVSINVELCNQIIKELLCVKYGLVSLSLFHVSQIDFMLESLCTQELFLSTFYLYFLYDFIINI